VVREMEQEKVISKVKSIYFQYEQKKYLPLRSPDLSILTAQESKHIDEVLALLAEKNATELSNYSHGDVPWKVTNDGEVISYKLVFQREDPYACRDYDALLEVAAGDDLIKALGPMPKEEYEYYENLTKKNAKRD